MSRLERRLLEGDPLDVRGGAVLHYGGRGYSEVWELLADSPALVGAADPTQASQCNPQAAIAFSETNPGDPGYLQAGGPTCTKFNGITTIQDYGTFSFDAGLNVHMGPYARLLLGVNLQTDTRHYLTFADRGDPDGTGSNPDVVEPGTSEVNPVRRDVVDNVGRRYVIDDVLNTFGYLRLWVTF